MSLPEMIEVKSSNISKIGWDGSDLYVEYKSGAVYKYKNVPLEEYEALLDTDSKGRYMNENIKPRFNYDYLR